MSFCPNCGFKLPDLTGTNPNDRSGEKAKGESGSGFDTAGPLLGKSGQVPPVGSAGPVKKKIGFFGTLALTGLVIFGFYLLMQLILDGGTLRNCIGSSPSDAPECSDCSKELEPTTLNGRSLGKCRAVPGTGHYEDQCNIVECQ